MEFFSCRHSAELLSLREERPLGPRESVELYVHLAMCAGCRNFRRQMGFMRKALRRLPEEQADRSAP
jgi:predicted anti-sigma-YlaC factor YlaD